MLLLQSALCLRKGLGGFKNLKTISPFFFLTLLNWLYFRGGITGEHWGHVPLPRVGHKHTLSGPICSSISRGQGAGLSARALLEALGHLYYDYSIFCIYIYSSEKLDYACLLSVFHNFKW